MPFLEATVAEYQRAVFVCRINVLGGVVDGMCQQIDVVAPFLYVSNVLYVSFYSDIPVFLPFAGKRFEADIENVSFEEDAVVHAVFHLAFQILFHPAGKAFPVFRKDEFQIIVHIDVLHLFRTHDARMACITEYAGLGIVLPVSDEGGLLYFVELVVFLFEFQFALAAFCDVAVLAEDHAVVRVHDAFKVIGSVTQCHFVIMD